MKLLFWTTTLLTIAATRAFTPSFKAPKTAAATTSHPLNAVMEKPTRIEIEEAAGQRVTIPQNRQQDAVQGFMSKTEGECTKYACMASDPLLQKKFEKLTKPRPYNLFLLEKAAKILGDVLPKPVTIPDTTTANGNTPVKEKLVILGTGWGGAALLQDVDNVRYDVTVISPRNYFLFTPMLAGAGVGTVDVRSITQPIREFNRKANYLEAAADSIDPDRRVVHCTGIQCDDTCEIAEFEVPYDRLVVAVGSSVNTFGIPGVKEYCSFLKQVDDARSIRRKIINLFETANFPGQSEENLRKLLTFAVIGAGPTGVEFAAELRDFVEEDGPKYYPHLLKYVSIKVIEATPVVLRPFDKALQQAAVEALTAPPKDSRLLRFDLTQLIVDKPVEKVTEEAIHLKDGTEIPYGLVVWAGGIGPLPITLKIIESLGGMQERAQRVARGKIGVDPWMRAVEGKGRIFALGDCTCTQGSCLPATGQVAAQEGEYLAHLLNVGNFSVAEYDGELLLPPKVDKRRARPNDFVAGLVTSDGEYVAPFQFLDLGILAYTGRWSALAQMKIDQSQVQASGPLGFGLWRGVYWAKQASMRNRVLVLLDWVKTRLFGRDITGIA